jgi:L-arabinose transport system ATP-binding protein
MQVSPDRPSPHQHPAGEAGRQGAVGERTASAPPLLRVETVSKHFGVVQALRNVSLGISQGEVLALIGENGAGKSTLMRILEGEYRPDNGSIEMDGRPLELSSPRMAHAAGIRVIHQEPEIIPELTVAENIFLGAFRAKGVVFLDQDDLSRRTNALLAAFGMDRVLEPDSLCRGLGPAQRQLIEIMRALRPGVRLIAFDEPTSSLTEDEAARLFEMIRKLRSEGVAIVYISHRLREVSLLADRVAVLRDGELVASDAIGRLTEDRMVELMVGRPLNDLFGRAERTAGAVRLSVKGLANSKVRDVSLDVRAGEIVGLGGLVGAGRSELARALMGIDRVSSGSVSVDGIEVPTGSPRRAIAAGIGLVPEDRKQEALLLVQSVRDNTSLMVPEKVSRYGFFQPRRERGLVGRIVERLRVRTPSLEQPVGKLSGGNQQKVVFARWIAREPKVLILDEPTRGIDVGAKAEIYRIIEGLAADGMAILLISSEMTELIGLADRILVMAAGRIAGELEGDRATEKAILDLAMSDHKTGAGPR